MNGRDAFNEELLSAYLDGELTLEERHVVERLLESSHEHRQLLERLRRLGEQLHDLPRERLDASCVEGVLARIRELPASVRLPSEEQSDELISAYLDGEVTPQERQAVERLLETSPRHRELLEQFSRLADQLADLPLERPGEQFTDQLLARLSEVGAPAPAPQDEWSDELLSAYLDDELSPEQRRGVEERVARDAECRHTLEELRQLHARLETLPHYALDEQFTSGVLRAIDSSLEQGTDGSSTVEEPPVVRRAAQGARWRQVLWAVAATAAAVLLIISVAPPNLFKPNPKVAGVEGPGTEGVVGESQETEAEIGTQDAGADRPPNSSGGESRPQAKPRPQPSLPPLQLASYLSNDMLMVYEITVKPNSVSQQPFSDLLNRFQIRPHEAYALNQRQQQLLLRHRFLEGAQMIEEPASDMDPVRLYMVSCTGQQAEAIWSELKSGPPEFGSFFINLTSRLANQAVLNQVCKASGVKEESGRAAQLLGGFAILSRTGRNLGMFGMTSMDLSELLVAPSQRKRLPEPGEDRERLESTRRGEDPTEILFVIRDLRPLNSGG